MNILQQIATLLGVKLTKVHEKTVANKEAIEAEADRAKGAEETIINNLNSEISRAKAAEKANTDAITAIDEAYQEADTALQTAINNEAAARTAADNSLSARITTEVGERKDADTALDEKKVDKVEGKQLSTEDYTTAEKTKVKYLEPFLIGINVDGLPNLEDIALDEIRKDPVSGDISRFKAKIPLATNSNNGLISPAQKLVLDNLLSGDSALSTLGTPSSTWQLNLGSGPKIKNSGGIFELRNAADSAYADLTVNALTIKGNVTQEGGSFITQAETVSAKDNTILLNSGETGAGVTKGTAGVEIDRGTLPKYKFVFDESDDRFKVGSEGDLWSVMLRDNETDLTDKGILTWDATTKRAKTAFNIDDLADTYLPLAGGTMTGMIKMPSSSSSLLFTGKQVDGSDYKASISFFEPPTPSTPPSLLIGTLVSNARINLSAQGGLFFSDGSIPYKVWHGGNDGADSGLDADLLDGQHGSYYAKATDLGNYIPLAGNSKETPITGHLYTEDVFSWGLYGMKIEGADGLPRTAHIQFNANQTGAMGSEPAKSNAYTEMGSIGEVWGPNTVSQLRVGYEDNLPVLKYRNNPEGPEIKEYNIYHEGNLDVNSMVSGFLPLSGGTMTGNIILPKNVSNNPSLKGLIGEPGWLTRPAGIRGNSILTYHEDNIMLGNDKAILQSIAHTSVIVAENELILSAPMIAINTASISCGGEAEIWTSGNDGVGSGLDADLLDGQQGSYYATASALADKSTLVIAEVQNENDAVPSSINTTGVFKVRETSTAGNDGFIWANNWGNNYATQLYIDVDMTHIMSFRQRGSTGVWNDWYTIASTKDLGKYLPLSGGTLIGDLTLNNKSILPSADGTCYLGSTSKRFANIYGNLTGRATKLGDGLTYAWIGGTFISGLTSPAGILIKLPHKASSGKMFQFTIRIYSSYEICNLVVGGYLYSEDGGKVYSPKVVMSAGTISKRVVIGKDSSNNVYVWIAGPNNYTGVAVTDIINGYATADWSTGFELALAMDSSVITSTYYDKTVNPPITSADLVWGNITGKPSFATVATSGSYNDLSNKPTIPSIPSSLKNPYAITFTGAVTGTYDGSAAKTVNIPSVPSLSGGAGATSGQYVSGVTVSGHTVTVSKASLPTSLPANGGNATTATSSTALSVRDLRASAIAPTYGDKALVAWFNNLGTPNGEWWSGIHVKGWEAGYQAWQLAGPSDSTNPATDALWYKSGRSSAWNTWRRLAFANEIPTTLPASDVYAWAKASTKPSYAWSEITGKPTIPSLSGYATQSWVQSQGYLTSHQSLANYVTLNTTQTISGAKTFTAFVVCSAGSGTSSDIRLKKYINRMFDAEEVLSNLSGYRYVMKETDMHYAGLIAQEVQEVLPEAVREDENGFLTVDTYPIVAALVEANKAKDNRIKALEDRLSALEKKMSLILNKLGNE